MKAYDTVVIINLSQGDEKVAETLTYVEKAIEGFSGKVKNIEKWGKRLLAYPIGKNTEGFYALVKFDLDPENVAKLKGKLRLNEMVVREMTLIEQPYFAPPVFSQAVSAAAAADEAADEADDASAEEAGDEAEFSDSDTNETEE